MGIVLKNNAHTVLSANMSSLDTTIYVDSVSSFPTLSAGQYFYCTIESTTGTYEIVKVTQVNTSSFSVTRAQENTIAVPFNIGARVELRITVQSLQDQFGSAVPAAVSALIGVTIQGYDTDLTTWAGLTPSANFQTLVPETFAQMRTSLGLVIGANVQAWDTDLDTWATITRASGFDTFVVTPSSANLAALITNETGSGALVFGTNPTLAVKDNAITFESHTFAGAKFQFDATNLLIPTTTIFTLPGDNTADTLVGIAAAQTLSNKTFVAPALGAATATSLTASAMITSAQAVAPPASGATTCGVKVSSTANLGWYVGTGAPTFSAAKGSLYSNTTATTTTTRLYVNTDGSTTWTNFTSAA